MKLHLPRKLFAASHVKNARMIYLAFAITVVGLIFLPFSWGWAIGAFVAFQFYWICGLTVGWHRYFTHGAFKTSTFWEEVMLAAGCISMSGHPGAFAIVHLNHHRYSDTDKDPHLLYKDVVFAATKLEGIEVTKSMMKRYFLPQQMKRVYQLYLLYSLLTILFLLLFSFQAVVYLWAIPVVVMQGLRKYVLVTLVHSKQFGYVTYDTGDGSKNSKLLGWLFGGEGYHNNHHHKPGDWKFSHVKWEFDPGSWFVRLIRTPKTT